MAQVNWTVKGRLMVEDFLVPNTRVDVDAPDGTLVESRSLSGVRLKVTASTLANGPYGSFAASVTTGRDGNFEIMARKSEAPRKFRISVELEDDTLSVREGNVKETLVVYESTGFEASRTLDLGTRVLRSGTGGNVIRSTHMKLLAWYVCREVIKYLDGIGHPFRHKFHMHTPASTISGSSWARGIGSDNVYVTPDAFNLVTLVHEPMHLWNYQHNTGNSNWLGAVWGDSDTAGFQEKPNIAFHEGFAEYAAWELMHLIWGLPKALPYSRRNLAVTRSLTTLEMVEGNWKGVVGCLRMLTASNPAQLIVGAASDTASGTYAVERMARNCPSGQLVSFADLLRVFSPGGGWNSDWEVGQGSYGVRRFFRRASDILDTFSDTASQLMLDVLDPSGTTEIRSRCGDLLDTVPPRSRLQIAQRARNTPASRRRPAAAGVETRYRHRGRSGR
jgi:hypothetical protein